MTGLDELRVSWAALSGAPTTDGEHVATLPLVERLGDQSLLVGRDLDGRRHLLVPASSSTAVEDTSSEAVQIVETRLGAGEETRRFTDIVCRDPTLADVFDDLILAMLRAVTAKDVDATTACVNTLESWRAMLRPPPRDALSIRQTAGLIAELDTVIELLRRDPAKRVDVWTGPTGARHDFRRGHRALEVKASLLRGETVAEVHGLDQLEPPQDGDLHLLWMRMEHVPEGALTVAALVEELRRLVGGSPALYGRLNQAGWRPEAAAEHAGFEIRERRMYAVASEFPRLVPSMLSGGKVPGGVRDVRYSLVLDAIVPLHEAARARFLEDLASG